MILIKRTKLPNEHNVFIKTMLRRLEIEGCHLLLFSFISSDVKCFGTLSRNDIWFSKRSFLIVVFMLY